MKKALAILLALSMVFAAFADAPAADLSVVSVTGSASLEWESNLEAETNGFKNSAEAVVKINLFNGGDASTSGDGMWGELKVVTDKDGFVEVKGKETAALASKIETVPMIAKIDTAKIHFVEGDVAIALNILTPGLGLGEVVLPTAAAPEVKSDAFNVNTGDVLKAGFALEVKTTPIEVNFKVMDNGVAADKEWGFAADATVKAIENVNVKAGFAYSTASELTAITASADYKYAIDDKLYVKPVVAYGMMDEAKSLEAGVLFGWGADGQKPEFALLNKDSEKFADGFSVTFKTDLDETDKIAFGLYDSTLVEGLKVGAQYIATLDDFGEGALACGVKYGTDIDILSIALEFGYANDLATEVDNYIYSVEVSTDDVIDNTTLSAKYAGGKDDNGKITVGAKIAL